MKKSLSKANTLTSRKYVCVNQAGRKFTTYLEDIPALLMRQDGKASDIHKNDELYPLFLVNRLTNVSKIE